MGSERDFSAGGCWGWEGGNEDLFSVSVVSVRVVWAESWGKLYSQREKKEGKEKLFR